MKNDMNFFPGHVVTLRSGGPEMTVTYVDANSESIECSWFNSALSPERLYRSFLPQVLRLREDQPPHGYPDVSLNPGQIVKLRSGGPAMTVRFIENRNVINEASCIWFDEDNRCELPLVASIHLNALVVES